MITVLMVLPIITIIYQKHIQCDLAIKLGRRLFLIEWLAYLTKNILLEFDKSIFENNLMSNVA